MKYTFLFEWMRQSVHDFFFIVGLYMYAIGGPVIKRGVESLDLIKRFNPTTFLVHVPS